MITQHMPHTLKTPLRNANEKQRPWISSKVLYHFSTLNTMFNLKQLYEHCM